MREEFILGHNFKDYIREAINIYVASNYLSRAIIDNIKATLNELPFHGGKNFKFLVNHDFHENESMRQVLLNMLLELPNTEVKIYEGPRRFHAKLYIFESGNTFFTAVGSFNATAGGAGNNIEAGIRTANRDIVLEAKKFFEEYWNSEYTRIAEIDDSAVFIRRKFRPGDFVIEKSTDQKGVVLSAPPELVEQAWIYSVYINGIEKRISEKNLLPQRISYISNEDDFTFDAKKIEINTWLSNYLIQKAFDLADRTLLSYTSSRTKTFEYQFRPLFKLLKSREHRLLIADEVGLGKTIEAGIILKELSSRAICKKVLIIVPNSLKIKWQDELKIRFDEYIDILTHKNIISFLKDYERSPDSALIKGIITYDQIGNPAITRYLEKFSTPPAFDIIIIDEAHHLKNSETKRHKIVSKISKNAKGLIMLTATPIQLRTQDLYNMLSILLPGLFFASDSRNFSGRLTVNERINNAVKYLIDGNIDAFQQIIKELSTTRYFRDQLENIGNFDSLMEKCNTVDGSTDRKTTRKLALEIYEFNILNAYINRTLRKDVSLSFPKRSIVTFEYEYTKEEDKLYNSILDYCRAKYRTNKSAFNVIMPERRAASSLIAMSLSYNEDNWKSQIEEYCNNYESEENDIPEVNKPDENQAGGDIEGFTNELKTDSKLIKLLEIINGIFNENRDTSDRKILIFCVFLATVYYLKKMLIKQYPGCYIDTIQGGDEIFERDNKRKQFAKNDKPSILICTEVAGEGLDFQFCHNLINYDMPWNPSKLEQRVGRIDRIGQKAEKINVINLVNKVTIEDRIMARLFERVKLFNSTIGPLGEILSRCQKEFKSLMLSPKRTQEEKEIYEQKILENIEAKKDEQKAFEEQEMAIVGAMDNIYYEKRSKPQYFSPEEIMKLWEFILDRLEVNANLIVEDKSNPNIFSIIVDPKIKSILNEMIDESPFDMFNDRKKTHYKQLIETHFNKKIPIIYTFDQETALENLSIEYLTLTHPFIQGGIKRLSGIFNLNKKALFCTLSSRDKAKGTYLIAIYRFIIINSNIGKKEFVEEQYLCLHPIDEKDPWELGESIFQDFVKNKTSKSTGPKEITNIFASNREITRTNVYQMAGKILKSYIRLSGDRLKAQKHSLNEFYEDKKRAIKQNMRYIHDESVRDGLEKEISQLDKELRSRLEVLSAAELIITVKCTGIIYVEVL